MKVLVTGANGFIGSYVCREFEATTRVDLYKAKRNINRFKELGNNVIEIDLQQPLFEQHIETLQPDVIVHTAALSQVDYCQENQEEAWRVNVEATRIISEISAKRRIRLIFLSSDFVFSGQNEYETEDSKTAPVSFYGQTKEEAEKIITTNCHNFIIIRPVLVYGYPLQSGRDNFLTFVLKNLKQNKQLNIVSDQYRTPLYVVDLARLIVKAASSDLTGIYHVAGPDYLSVYEFARSIAQHWKFNDTLINQISSESLNQPGRRPPKTRFLNTKTFNDFGIDTLSINEAFNYMTNDYRR